MFFNIVVGKCTHKFIILSVPLHSRTERNDVVNYDVAYTWIEGHSLVKDTNRITLMTETWQTMQDDDGKSVVLMKYENN